MSRVILFLVAILFFGVAAFMVVGIFQEGEESQETQTKSFAEEVEYKIIGIEPGAGIMINTERAMEEYGLKEAGWELQESSSAAMMAAFQDALENEEPIVVTIWEPHALFSLADIRKLEDAKGLYNNPAKTSEFLAQHAPAWAEAQVASDVVGTVVYKGFGDLAPAAYRFFQNFSVESSVQSNWIFQLTVEEREPEEIAAEYIQANQELVASWRPQDAELGKKEIVIGIPPWPGVIVKSRVVAQILQEIGYKTKIQEVDVGVVYTGLADKQLDVTLAGWLPSTHEEYWDAKGNELEVTGVNIQNTWLGLGVPNYVDEEIQSVEDLVR